MWNEKNQPALDPEEFEYQFEQMFNRWGAPREELTFEEEIRSVENFEDEHERLEALIHMLDGRRLPTMEYNLWRRRLKTDYGLSNKEFDSMVHRTPGGGGADGIDPQAPVNVEGDRRVAAIALLNDPGILHRVLVGFREDGLVGEEANALLLYIAATSRLTEDPVNIISLGSAASGKSIVMLTALKFIPEEEKIVRQRFSAQALVYTDLSFKNKVICILERAGGESSSYNIRTLQSEKHIIVEVTTKQEATGKMTTTQYPKEGPAAFITSTTDPEIDQQDESRVWILHPDETRRQTHHIMQSQEEEHEISEEDLQVFLDAQRLLSVLPVAHPTRLIRAIGTLIRRKLPDTPIRMRRDHNRLIHAIKASTILHQYQRATNEEGKLVPDLRDYYVAWRIASMAFQQSIHGRMDPKVQEVAETVRTLFLESQEPVRTEQIAASMGLQTAATYKWITRALSAGLVSRGDRGRYAPVGAQSYLGDLQVLPTPNEVLELDPELGVGIELVDPVTGEELSNAE